ncbi:hypothetical protein JOM56_012571 [Amanita muscaria]
MHTPTRVATHTGYRRPRTHAHTMKKAVLENSFDQEQLFLHSDQSYLQTCKTNLCKAIVTGNSSRPHSYALQVMEKRPERGWIERESKGRECPASPPVPGIQPVGNQNTQNSATSSPPSRPMIDTVDEPFMLLGGQRNQATHSINSGISCKACWIATVLLAMDGSKSPPGAETPQPKKDDNNASDTEVEEHIFARLSKCVGITREASKLQNNGALSSDEFEDISIGTEKRLATMERVIQLRKEQDMQLHDGIFQATCKAQRAILNEEPADPGTRLALALLSEAMYGHPQNAERFKTCVGYELLSHAMLSLISGSQRTKETLGLLPSLSLHGLSSSSFFTHLRTNCHSPPPGQTLVINAGAMQGSKALFLDCQQPFLLSSLETCSEPRPLVLMPGIPLVERKEAEPRAHHAQLARWPELTLAPSATEPAGPMPLRSAPSAQLAG